MKVCNLLTFMHDVKAAFLEDKAYLLLKFHCFLQLFAQSGTGLVFSRTGS